MPVKYSVGGRGNMGIAAMVRHWLFVEGVSLATARRRLLVTHKKDRVSRLLKPYINNNQAEAAQAAAAAAAAAAEEAVAAAAAAARAAAAAAEAV